MRYNKKYVWYRAIIFLSGVIPFLFLLISFSFNDSEELEEGESTFSGFLGINSSGKLILGLAIVFVIYTIIDFIISYLYWKKTTYSFNNNDITLEKGVIFKNKIVLNYENIHAVNIDRNLIMRLFHMSKLCIDSGNASKSGLNEIEIIDTISIIEQMEKDVKERLALSKKQKIRSELDEIKSNDIKLEDKKDVEIPYKFDKKMRTKMTFCSLPFWLIFFFVLLFTIFIDVFAITQEGFDLTVIIASAIIFVIAEIAIILACKLVYLICYYGYKVSVNDEEIMIEYGLIHQRKYFLQKNKIMSVFVKEDIVQMKKGYASLHVKMVGLIENNKENNGSSEYNYLFPFIKKSDLELYLKALNIGYEPKEITKKCRKNSFKYFVILPLLIPFIFLIPAIIGFINSYIVFLILGIYILYAILILILMAFRYRNQAIDFDDKFIYFSNGVLIKKYYMMPWKSVVNIGTFATPVREKDNVTSIVIEYYSNKNNSRERVSMIDVKTFAELLLFFESIKNR